MTFHEEAGKGSNQRPSDVSGEKYRENWDTIFGKKAKKEAFERNKVENFKHSTHLSEEMREFIKEAKEAFARPVECGTCKDMGGCYDAGWYYECTSCGK